MNEKLKTIHEYLVSKGHKEENLALEDTQSVYLSMNIMEYCFRNYDSDRGGDPYTLHFLNALEYYRHLVGIIPDDLFCIDLEMLAEYEIPFDGVQELCLLQGVLLTKEITYSELEQIFADCGFERFFKRCLGPRLKLLSKDRKSHNSETFAVVASDPCMAMVKMATLQDQLVVFGRNDLNKKMLSRKLNEMNQLFAIESRHHFMKYADDYRFEFEWEQQYQDSETESNS